MISFDFQPAKPSFHTGSDQPQVFPPAVYHDQQGAAALNFNS